MARVWDSAFTRWTHTPWKTRIDRNSIGSIGLLVDRKFLDRITTLRLITSIRAWLTRTFSFGHHISRLDHTLMGSSTITWVLASCYVYLCLLNFLLRWVFFLASLLPSSSWLCPPFGRPFLPPTGWPTLCPFISIPTATVGATSRRGSVQHYD